MGAIRWLSKKTGMPIWRGTPSEIEYEKVPERPVGTRISEHNAEKAVFSFQAMVKYWWLLPVALIVGLFAVILPFSGGMAAFGGPVGALVGLVILAAYVFLTWKSIGWGFPWVEVIATREYVRVGPYYFDRARYGGITIGYQITYGSTTHSGGDSGFPMIWKGLRLNYGPWGKDLPYLVNDFHSVEVALWLSAMIASVKKPPEGSSTEHGTRTQKFAD